MCLNVMFKHVFEHVCDHEFEHVFNNVFEHVCEHVFENVFDNVFDHVCEHVFEHVFNHAPDTMLHRWPRFDLALGTRTPRRRGVRRGTSTPSTGGGTPSATSASPRRRIRVSSSRASVRVFFVFLEYKLRTIMFPWFSVAEPPRGICVCEP